MKNLVHYVRPLAVVGLLALSSAAVAQNIGPLTYGYVTQYNQTSSNSDAMIGWLANYHIRYVQFYDWQWKHEIPLAGTRAQPAASWTGFRLGQTIQRQSVLDLINSCHTRSMLAMNYNLIYGAWNGWGNDDPTHLNDSMRLLNSPGGGQWAIEFDTTVFQPQFIFMFNPANTGWQSWIFSHENDVFADYPFDGWQIDQLGDPGVKYDNSGNAVNVWSTFPAFINAARTQTNRRIIFNNVGTYGLYGVANQTSEDAVYIECWEQNGQTTYNDLKQVIENGLAWSNATKPVVLAAYMDRGLRNTTGRSFGTPGVLLCDAVIFASGGTHLELGDGGYMLSNEYFPNHNVALSASLATTLVTYYNFIQTYRSWLYGGFSTSGNVVWTSIPSTGAAASPNNVWAMCKTRGSQTMINLINLIGENSINWRDDNGDYRVPTPQSNFTLKYYPGAQASNTVTIASPDVNAGASRSLSFTRGSDGGGNFIQFTVPSLAYWDLIMIQ